MSPFHSDGRSASKVVGGVVDLRRNSPRRSMTQS